MGKKKIKATAALVKPSVKKSAPAGKKAAPTGKKAALTGKKAASVGKKAAPVGKKAALDENKADLKQSGNENSTGEAKPKRLRKMTPKQKELQEILILKQMKASPLRKVSIPLKSVISKKEIDTSANDDEFDNDAKENETPLNEQKYQDEISTTPTIDDNLMEIFGEISTLQTFELQDSIDTDSIEDEKNVSKQDEAPEDIRIQNKDLPKNIKEIKTGTIKEIAEKRSSSRLNDTSEEKHDNINMENEVKDSEEIFGKKISKKMFEKPKDVVKTSSIINDLSEEKSDKEIVDHEIISELDKVQEVKINQKKKKKKEVKTRDTEEPNNEDQNLQHMEIKSSSIEGSSTLLKNESNSSVETFNTDIKNVSVSIVDDNDLHWIQDLVIILPAVKEDKVAAKLKKENDLDKLEEDLRRMHPEENEEEQSKPMVVEQQNVSKLEETSHPTIPKLEETSLQNKPHMKQSSPLSKPKQRELSPKKKSKHPESGQLNLQKGEKSSQQNLPKPMEPIKQNLHKLSYAELILKVESSVAQIAELQFKNVNLEEVTRINEEKVIKLQKRPSKEQIADILQKLENTTKENQNLKKKVSSLSVKGTSDTKEKDLNALKEKFEKEKAEIVDKCKTLENKYIQLKEDKSKLQAKLSHQKDKADGSSKFLELEDKSGQDKSKLKLENSKLNDQVSRLKSSNLGKENTIKRLEDQLSKVKEEHKSLEHEVQANRSTKEQNKFLERINKTNTEKIKKLEHEASQAANQHKEFVALRRENYEKNHVIQEIRTQMATFETNCRKAQAEIENLQKSIVDLNNDKNSLNIELGRVMKENINLLEDKKKMIEGNKELLELQMKYKASKQTLEKYIEKYRWCKDNHHKLSSSKPDTDTIVTGNLVQPNFSLPRPAASSTPSLSRPVASSTPAPPSTKSGTLPLPGGLPLPGIQSNIRPSVDEDEAPYDPEADIDNIFDTAEAAHIINANQSTVSEASNSDKINEKETGSGRSSRETSVQNLDYSRSAKEPSVQDVPSSRSTRDPSVQDIPSSRSTRDPSVQDIPSGRMSREPIIQDMPSGRMSREPSIQDMPSGRSSRSSIVQDDDVPPPPRIRDDLKINERPASIPVSTSPHEIPLPSPSRIRVINTPLLRDPRQRRRQASGEGMATKGDKEVTEQSKTEILEEAPLVPRYYTPNKNLPLEAQPDMSIAESESNEEVAADSAGHRVEAWQAFNNILNQEISPRTKITPKEEYVEKVDLKEESVVILAESDQVRSRQPASTSNRKRRSYRSSSSSSRSSSRDSSRHGSRSKKTSKRDRSRSKSRSREKRSRKRSSSKSSSRKRKRSTSKTRRRHNSKSRNRSKSRSKRSGSRSKRRSTSRSRRRSTSRSKWRSRSKRRSRSRSGGRKSNSKSSRSHKRSRSNSGKKTRSNSKEKKKSVSPNDIKITREVTKVQPGGRKVHLGAGTAARKGYSTSQLKDILVNNVDSVIKELTDQIIKTDSIPLPPPPQTSTITTSIPSIPVSVPVPVVTSIPSAQPILWGPLQDAVNSIAQQHDAINSIAQQHEAINSIAQQHVPFLPAQLPHLYPAVSSAQLPHLHPAVNMPAPLHLPGLDLQHGVPTFIQDTSVPSFLQDTSVPPPGFMDHFPKDKINQQFAVDLGDFMYAKGGESKGKVGGQQMSKGSLPRPVSSAPTTSVNKGFTGSNAEDNEGLKKYYMAPDIHPTASTVQWKDYCSSCGDFVINKDDHYLESKEDVKPSEGDEETEKTCKKIHELKQSLGKVLCKMCDSEEHVVNGCPLLCSFCYKCWCWGHTDSMHDKCPPFYILYLKRKYNLNRQEFHSSSTNTTKQSMPVNVFANNLCKYPGSVKELAMLASKLLPEGLFQPWLHPEWNKCKYKGF